MAAPVRWIDTHTHLDFPDFAPDRDAVLERARAAGVDRMIVIGTRLARLRPALEWVRTTQGLYATAGIHPCNVEEHDDDALDGLAALCRAERFAAIGECGLDYHHLPPRREGMEDDAWAAHLGAWKARQQDFFRAQLDLAVELGLNVVVHQRESWDDTLRVLEPYTGRLRAVFHCFGGTAAQADVLAARGHLVSFTGIATFKNAAAVQEAAATRARGGFMLETDCPYLAPVPHRGKRCEPAHVAVIGAHLAGLRNEAPGDLAEHTNATAEAFFRLD